ncbi:DUF5327 family protein [Lentibacillus salinarum]|uniref:DUF5327 family protein n=1 Tax=Lentibacillus salinarum TaxID=446820 RepID=A0ABW3ZU86_9BACI
MAVETGTILHKMKRELAHAQQTDADEPAMKHHVANIRLLCELLLEEPSTSPSPSDSGRDVTAAEVKAMMGEKSPERTAKPTSLTDDHDGANGSSIFDF